MSQNALYTKNDSENEVKSTPMEFPCEIHSRCVILRFCYIRSKPKRTNFDERERRRVKGKIDQSHAIFISHVLTIPLPINHSLELCTFLILRILRCSYFIVAVFVAAILKNSRQPTFFRRCFDSQNV